MTTAEATDDGRIAERFSGVNEGELTVVELDSCSMTPLDVASCEDYRPNGLHVEGVRRCAGLSAA